MKLNLTKFKAYLPEFYEKLTGRSPDVIEASHSNDLLGRPVIKDLIAWSENVGGIVLDENGEFTTTTALNSEYREIIKNTLKDFVEDTPSIDFYFDDDK